jgi:hypothetical protein
MRRIRALAAASALMAALAPVAAWAQTPSKMHGAWLFVYFKEPANQGIYYALSRDGYHFTPLNDGQPWLPPSQAGELMRDPFLTRSPNGLYRLVWTWGWHGNSMGYSTSTDLLTWPEQKQIPIMQDYPEVNNVWAPRTYWDAKRKEWLIIWSSAMKDSKSGDRIWSSFTPDFNTFSKPQVFFDPGYVTIDATIFHEPGGPYRMVYKDQTYDPLSFQERVATGPTLTGPWNHISGPINESWSEGPSVIHVGKWYIVYYDHYRPPRARYEGVATADWKHWIDITPETSFPEYCKHGSFLKITDAEAARLLARHNALETPPVTKD